MKQVEEDTTMEIIHVHKVEESVVLKCPHHSKQSTGFNIILIEIPMAFLRKGKEQLQNFHGTTKDTE